MHIIIAAKKKRDFIDVWMLIRRNNKYEYIKINGDSDIERNKNYANF